MFTFLDGDAPTELVVREGARKKLTFPESRIAYELLTNDLSHQLAGFVIRLEPGASNQARQLFRPTEELMFVVQGEMDILVGERQYHLCAGDSITYEGTRLRSYTNPGTQDLIVVCAMTPPAL
jgi:mannose-6-phosphate isomerase-like protein (cupin superfamily)